MDPLQSARRLATLRATGLLDADSDEVLGRLARVATHVLDTPVSLVTLIDAGRQFFAANAGLTGPMADDRQAPLENSYCKNVVIDDAPFVVTDKLTDPRVMDHESDAIAYAGFPLRAPNGEVLGTFCVFQDRPRVWTARELEIVEDLTAAAAAEIALLLANKDLEVAEIRMTNMLNASHDAFVAMSADGRVERWNPSAERLFGYTEAQALGQRVADLIIPPELVPRHEAGLERVRRERRSRLAGQRVELPARRADGSSFAVELSLMYQVEPELYFNAFLHDISARKEAEETLASQRTYLQSLVDALHNPVIACDAGGRLLVVNQAADQLGLDLTERPGMVHYVDDLVGDTVYAADGRTHLSQADNALRRALEGEAVDNQEIVHDTPGDGVVGRRRYAVTARPVDAASGNRLGAVVVLHDITEARRAETLRHAQHAVVAALSNVQSSEDAGVIAVGALAEALGWAGAEFWRASDDGDVLIRVGSWSRPGHDLTPLLDDRPLQLQRDVSVAGRVLATQQSIWIADLDTSPTYFARHEQARRAGVRSVLGVPVLSGGRVLGVLAFFNDTVVERAPDLAAMLEEIGVSLGEFLQLSRQREVLLDNEREQVVRLREIDKMKDELIAIVSHELRNPITTIAGFAELLADDDAMDEEQRSFVAGIERNSTHLLEIVSDLLTMAALNRGPLPIQRRPISLDQLLRQAIDEQRPQAAAKELAVAAEIEPGLVISGDPTRLRQAVDNLLSNAIKYTLDGGGFRVAARRRDDVAVVEVADNGIGIPPEQFGQLFTPFFRTSTALDSGIKGTGLGLAITKEIAEAHGGSIEVRPNQPQGTAFSLRLPLIAG